MRNIDSSYVCVSAAPGGGYREQDVFCCSLHPCTHAWLGLVDQKK